MSSCFCHFTVHHRRGPECFSHHCQILSPPCQNSTFSVFAQTTAAVQKPIHTLSAQQPHFYSSLICHFGSQIFHVLIRISRVGRRPRFRRVSIVLTEDVITRELSTCSSLSGERLLSDWSTVTHCSSPQRHGAPLPGVCLRYVEGQRRKTDLVGLSGHHWHNKTHSIQHCK